MFLIGLLHFSFGFTDMVHAMRTAAMQHAQVKSHSRTGRREEKPTTRRA